MSYSKTTEFAIKDTMPDNNPLKVLRGKEFDDEFDALELAFTEMQNALNVLVTTPVGCIIMCATVSIPSGFLRCDGTAVSRSTYNSLFLQIGAYYGAGNGTTTFNLPNFNGRFPYGTTPGALGGQADAIIPYHAHTGSINVDISDPGHKHTMLTKQSLQPQSGASTPCWFGEAGGETDPAATGITATGSVSIDANGSSAIGANIPPFIGIHFIIKT